MSPHAVRTALIVALLTAHGGCHHANVVDARPVPTPTPDTSGHRALLSQVQPRDNPQPIASSEDGEGMRDSFVVVHAANPIQFPRGYFVGSQCWVTYATMAQDSIEVHLARVDPMQRAVLSQEVLTPLDHRLSAYASLAISPDRIALAMDDERFTARTSHVALFDRPRDEAVHTPLHNTYMMGMFANSTSASIAWSPTLQQWAQLAGSDSRVWFARLLPNGTLIEGSGAMLNAVNYSRSNGETFLWNGRAWAALVRTATGLAVLEFDAQSHRLIPLGRAVNGPIAEVSMDFDGSSYGLAWSDSEGVKFATVLDEQTPSPVTLLAPRTRYAGNPALAFDGTHHYLLWTEVEGHTLIRRARLSRDGRLVDTALFANHPTEHAWWPHVLASEGSPRRMMVTFQVGQSEARVWVR